MEINKFNIGDEVNVVGYKEEVEKNPWIVVGIELQNGPSLQYKLKDNNGFTKWFDEKYLKTTNIIIEPKKYLELINTPVSLDFEDVSLQQGKCQVKSRLDADISSEVIKGVNLQVPILSSNMSSVTNANLAILLNNLGGLGVLHRAYPTKEEYLNEVNLVAKECNWVAASVGIGNDQFELCKELVNNGCNIIVVDIAQGFSQPVIDLGKKIKKEIPDIKVVVGNVIAPEFLYEVADYADAVKAGIAGGCFAAGTRILMANGIYKNIEDVSVGDKVIDKDGNSVKVLNSFSTGIKETISVKNSSFYKPTIVTPDHLYFSGDLSSVSKNTLQSGGYSKILNKEYKKVTYNENGERIFNKIDWHEIGDNDKTLALLYPKNINFELNNSFEIPLKKRVGGNWRIGEIYDVDCVLVPTYELGYIFGTFLGDGTAHNSIYKNSKRGSVKWVFGKEENLIADKLLNCLTKVFNKNAKKEEKYNIINVFFYYKPFCDFLLSFGKRTEKHLPNELLVKNKDYLNGIYEGLLDSDGCYKKDNRTSFKNTSFKLIELFSILNFILFNYFPGQYKRKKTIGNLKNINIENLKDNFSCETFLKPNYRIVKEYQVAKIMKKELNHIMTKVYDLTTETHSFIADNCIVHNSACETKNTAGCYQKQFSTIIQMSDLAKHLGIPLIADGSIREPSSLVKAIAGGASSVMIGGGIAKCPESAAKLIEIDGVRKKIFSGMACYSQDTEVLTKKGWKYFNELNKEDKIATLNKNTEKLEYQKFTGFFEYDYSGKMIEVKSKSIDLCVTPNHMMYVAKTHSKKKFNTFKLVPAEECINGHTYVYKKNAKWVGKRKEMFTVPSINSIRPSKLNNMFNVSCDGFSVPMKEWVDFFGFWLAEGCAYKFNIHNIESHFSYQVSISNNNKEIIDHYFEMLSSWGLNPYIRNRGKNYEIYVHNLPLYSYLSIFGKANEKYIPEDIKNLPKEELSILLNSIFLGDGCMSRNCIYTNSTKLRDDICEIVLKCGGSPNIHLNHPKGSSGSINEKDFVRKHNVWSIYINDYHKNPKIKKQHYKEKNYSGKVYCVEVPNGIIMVRRNLKSVWCGNSRRVQEAWRGKVQNSCPEGKTIYLDVGEPLADFIERYCGALRSGISYVGATDIESLQKLAKFYRFK